MATDGPDRGPTRGQQHPMYIKMQKEMMKKEKKEKEEKDQILDDQVKSSSPTTTPTATAADVDDVEQGLDLNNVENLVPTPPDGGWGWVIVLASFMCNVIVDGVAYTFGVILPDLEEYFQEPKSKISLVGSLLCGVYLFAGPIVSAMTNKFGCRPVVIFGSILSTVSFALSTLSPNVNVMIFFFGVMGGLGVGMIYLPAIVSVGYYFEKRRAFATGLAVCGSGVGTFVFPPFIEFMLIKYGWRGAVLILAGVMLQGCWFGALMRPLTLEVKADAPKSKKPRAKNILDRVKETTSRNAKNTANMINSIPDLVIREGVQKAMLKRQQTIQDSDTYIGSNASMVLPSTNHSQEEKDAMAANEVKGRTFIIRTESEEGETMSEDIIIVDPSKFLLHPKKRKYQKSEKLTSQSNIHKLNIPGARPGGGGGSRTNLTNLTTNSMRSINLSAKDLARPLYRKDIFYSGSVLHIPEIKSQSTVASYKANVTTIPGESELVGEPNITARCINFTCACLPRSARDVLSEMIDLSLFMDMSFMLICLGNLTAFMGFFVPFAFLVDYAVNMGNSKSNANFLISIIGIANTIGRVAIGKIADLGLIDSLIMTYLAIAVCGVSTLLFPLVSTYGLLATLATTFGLGVAAFISLSSIVICDRLGLEKLTNGFGLLSMARGVSSMAGPPFGGYLYDSTNSYNMSFTIAGILLIAGAACHAFLHLPSLRPKHKRQQPQQQQQTDSPEDVDADEEEEEEKETGPLMGSTPQTTDATKQLTEV